MVRRKRKSRGALLILVVLLALMAAAAWTKRDSLSLWFGRMLAGKPTAPGNTSPAEGRVQRISGELKGSGPARDGPLGVSANAAVLFRHVEMYQWQEHCEASGCRYDKAWAAAIDSHKFREPKGHENPPAPFNDSIFFAPGLKVGEYVVAPDLLVAQLHSTDHPVRDANLPPNLAASFSERDGVLYAGGDPVHPAIGEVRIGYRVVANGSVVLDGVVRGDKLVAR